MDIKYKLFKKPWPYWVGGTVLGVLNVILLFLTGSAWKVSTSFLYMGLWILDKIGINTNEWYYFNVYTNQFKFEDRYLNNSLIIMSLAIILGSLISVLFVSEFKVKKIKNKKQLLSALLGGIFMGYGVNLSFGCNIGGFFSAIPSFSLHGWVFGIFLFVGAWIGTKILLKYIL